MPPFSTKTGEPSTSGAESYYDVLGVDFSASRQEITRAFRKAMKEWHPDVVAWEHIGQSDEMAKRLNLAYGVLTDPVRRREYDNTLRVEAMQAQIMNQYVPGYGGMTGTATPAHAKRRNLTAFERREQSIADRRAQSSVLVLFGVLGLVVVGMLLVFSLASSIGQWLF